MAEQIAFPKPKMPAKDAIPCFRELAKNLDNMKWHHKHFKERLEERKITMRQVIETIEEGEVNHGPTLDEYGDWRIRLIRKCAGKRVQVVVAIKKTQFDLVTVI